MKAYNNATKARGVINVIVCLILTVSGGLFMIDEPIAKQTADFLRIPDLRIAAFLSAFLLSTTLSMIITFFIGMMIPGADLETTNGFMSNPISKVLCYIGFSTWILGAVIGFINSIITQTNNL
ncbi:hypothetical protein EON65_19150 [archaeon]|nr:MAG: hypothetical protein EON65_19150 [archaeon]